MMKIDNPWKNMDHLTQRRANPDTAHNIFWIRDTKGKYGFWISATSVTNFKEEAIKLKGITITKSLKPKGGDLFLLLESNEDWEVFKSLCEDLISVTVKYSDEEKMMSVIDIRLKKWQQMLKIASGKSFSLEEQMGLFGELVCLTEMIIPKIGPLEALHSWGGPEFDKQDFMLEDSVVEVKSAKTSRGEIATISSLGQLSTYKEKFFLAFYNISRSENGITIEELAEEIRKKNFNDNPLLIEMFEIKLNEYGYLSALKPELEKFQIDKRKAFTVTDQFPRLVPSQVDQRIVSVKYTIDLSRLTEFEINYDAVLEGD